MKLSKHCALCENEIRSLKIGLTCKLTKSKPNFKNTCSVIKLDTKFQNKLELAILELQQISKKKNSVHFTFYLYIIIGFSLIISSTAFAELSLSKTYFWYYKLVLISAGITTLTNAYFKLNRFRKKLQNAEHRKNEIDLVLDKYRISYDSKLVLEEKIHGTQDIRVEIKFKNWTKNQTATRYKMGC